MRGKLSTIPIRIMILALIAACLVQVTSGNVVMQIARVIAACSLVFILPGYALVAALFPKPESAGLGRFVLIVGTSLTISILGGFVLNWTSGGLNTISWTLLLGGITVAASLVALWRYSPSSSGRPAWTRGSLPELTPLLQRAAIFGLAVLVAVVAFMVARDAAVKNAGPGFTQLWFLPDANESQTFRLGFDNREARPVDYRLQVKRGDAILYDWPNIQLPDGQSWEVSITPPAGYAGSTEALLYRLDSPDSVYRSVTLRGNPPQVSSTQH